MEHFQRQTTWHDTKQASINSRKFKSYQAGAQTEKLGEKIPFTIYYTIKKNNVPTNKFNQRGKRPLLEKLQNTEERN